MEKHSFVKDGVLRLPPGFRFHPTDEELVVQYLRRKVLSCPLPALIIPEFDVCKSDPWDLPGNKEQERYFFSAKEGKYQNGNRSNRATGSGYWKATGKDKEIVDSKSNHVVGMKKTLFFYRGKPPHGSRTDWIMHEYRLIGVENATTIAPQKKNPAQSFMENWVLCRIFLKKRSSKRGDETMLSHNYNYSVATVTDTKLTYYDFMSNAKADLNLALSSSSSSSSSSSGVTEISCHESDDHEESSSCNSFSFRRKP